MKNRVVAVVLVAASCLLLSGCGVAEAQQKEEEKQQERYLACIEAGGSYWEEGSEQGFSCTLPDVPLDTRRAS